MSDEKFESTAVKRGLSREQAIEEGALLGAGDADRVARAKAYAAWDYDGRPESSQPQREEMGLGTLDVAGFLDRAKIWAKRGEQ